MTLAINPTFRSGSKSVDFDRIETRGVLAGAYRGRRRGLDQELTHLVFIGAGESFGFATGCRQPLDNMVDPYGHTVAEKRARPTCPTCATKYDRLVAEHGESILPAEDTMQTNAGQYNETAATELKLYIDNTSELMGPRSQGESIRQNLLRKIKKGTFDLERSVKAWEYVVESGAKMYVKEFGSGTPGEWHEMFSVPTRKAVAKEMAEEFYAQAKAGEFPEVGKLLGRLPSGHEPNRSPKPMSGYAYETHSHWQESSDEDWDTEMFTPSGGETFVGVRRIDDAKVNVFKLPSGGYIAQLEHMTRNHKGLLNRNANLPRPRPRVDTSLSRVSRLEQAQRRREKPFDPERPTPRETKPHHFSINHRSDVPAHLHAVRLNGYRDPPDGNGQSVPYDTFENDSSVEDSPDSWYEVEYASGSDYSGSSVTKANFKELQKMLNEEHPSAGEDAAQVVWVEAYGGHGTYAIFVRYRMLAEDIRSTLDALEDYPAISDESISEEESERETEAWENWTRRDFEKQFLSEYNAEYPDQEVDDWPEGADSATLFRVGMSISNTYWVHETGESVYVELDRVVPAAFELMSGEEPPPDWLGPDDWSAVLEAAKAFGLETK